MITMERVAEDEARREIKRAYQEWDKPTSARLWLLNIYKFRAAAASEYRKLGQIANAEYYTVVARTLALHLNATYCLMMRGEQVA